ncbi:MAG TPA: DNA (cytosine-5-)-methyltransferase, partial [Flavisolibacter sp.]|nr:DNA (cytosine-5-)-methyltransferase [Flavisolibacter sp.]
MMNKKATFIDLFAGIGGIRIGFEEAGFTCVFSSENDHWCQQTYHANFGEYPAGDITKIDENDIPKFDIITGGFPCQPFSISGRQKGFDDTRGTLFFDILRIIKHHQPKVIFLENVKHLQYHDKGNTLRTIRRHLEELGYIITIKVLNAIEFGSAQNRERIIIIGNKDKGFDFSKVKTKPAKKIKDILDKEGQYVHFTGEQIPLFDSSKIKKESLASKENTFVYLNEGEFTLIENPKVQKSGLIFAGYRNKSIRVNGTRPNTLHLSRVHKQPNRIYSSEGTHPTLPSQESAGRFWILHKGRVRKLTIDECYRLQGFPKNFKKVAKLGTQYLQIGNSVYIPMMKALADEI